MKCLKYKEATVAQNNSNDKVVVKKHCYKSGALWWETPYADGKMHGIERGYYESGALWWETPYVDGKKHGIEKNYDKDTSNIARLELYDKGRIVPLLWNLESNV
jgi:antitoxin component YwqK of YwqJK toxin-antitoxin module